jgi:thioredoxin-related protein
MIMKQAQLATLLTALFMSAVVVYADGVKFTTITTWNEALELAKQANKPIFLDAYTDWCGWCKVMDKETFSDEKVAAFMNANFVNVKMEMETGEGIDVAMKYRISAYPTFKVFAVDGSPTYTVMGYQEPKEWLKTLEMMTDPSKAQTAKGISSQLKLNYPEWHRGAFLKGKNKKIADAKTVQAWFDEQQDKYSEVSWCVITRYPLSEAQQAWIMEHESEYRALYGNEFNQIVQKHAQTVFNSAVEKKDKSLLEKASDLFTKTVPAEAESMRDRLQAMYYSRTGDWKQLGDAVDKMSQAAEASAASINEFAWNMYEKCEDNPSLVKAADAMKRTTKNLESSQWAFVDTYAALLYKTGQYDIAEEQALRAIDMGKEAKADVAETEELLAKIRKARSPKK